MTYLFVVRADQFPNLGFITIVLGLVNKMNYFNDLTYSRGELYYMKRGLWRE